MRQKGYTVSQKRDLEIGFIEDSLGIFDLLSAIGFCNIATRSLSYISFIGCVLANGVEVWRK